MNASDKLRKLLNERGVDYTTHDDMGACSTSWRGHTAYQLTPTSKLIMHPTPEQAIAATLGSEQPPVDGLIRCLENDYGITASWDGLRKVWLTERATQECIDEREKTLYPWGDDPAGQYDYFIDKQRRYGNGRQ